jgi:hypothetical protein
MTGDATRRCVVIKATKHFFFAQDATTHATSSRYSIYLLYLYNSTNSGGAVTRGTRARSAGTIPTLRSAIPISSHTRRRRQPALRVCMLATFFSSMPAFLLLLPPLFRRLLLLQQQLLLLVRSPSVLRCVAACVCNQGSSSEKLRFASSLALLRFCKAKTLLHFYKRLDSSRQVCGVKCGALHVWRQLV